MRSLFGVLLLLYVLHFANGNTSEEGELFEGDMELTEEQKINIQMSMDGIPTYGSTTLRNWPNPVAYTIDSALGSTGKSAILNAMADYEKYTCLRFKPRKRERAYLRFSTGTGCSSPVGYRGTVNQIKLARGCFRKGTIIHEIMHSLGFMHEQSRPDRDKHVDILWHNIPTKRKNNFKKYSYGFIKSGGSPYDYLSVMHYGRYAFGNGKVTIDAKNNFYDRKIGQRAGFSNEDINQLRAKYRC